MSLSEEEESFLIALYETKESEEILELLHSRYGEEASMEAGLALFIYSAVETIEFQRIFIEKLAAEKEAIH